MKWTTCLIFLLIMGIFTPLQSQTIYLSESFEGSWSGSPVAPSGWTQTQVQGGSGSGSNIDWVKSVYSSGNWTPGGSSGGSRPSAAHDGTAVAYYNDYNAQAGQIDRLASGNINLSTAAEVVVEFWYYADVPTTLSKPTIQLRASSNGGTTWNDISAELMPHGQYWQKYSYTLPMPQYQTSTVKIAFEITAAFSNKTCWLDDVVVKEQPMPLTGVKTINPAGGDYTSFTAAAADLATKGVGNGGVTFNVASGTYTEQFIISAINGASASNPIVFQSATGNKDDVVVQYEYTSADYNYLIKFDDADYVTFKNMTLQRLDAGPSYMYKRVIVFANGAHHNQLLNNNIIGIATEDMDLTQTFAVIYSGNSKDTANTIKDNFIQNGSYGIYFTGQSEAAKEKYNSIEGNSINDFSTCGIYLEKQIEAEIHNNLISSESYNTSSQSISAVELHISGNSNSITSNRIYIGNPYHNLGINLISVKSSLNFETIIANNFITQANGNTTATDPNSNTGINVYDGNYVDVLYNSINFTGGESDNSRNNCLSFNRQAAGNGEPSGNIIVLNNNAVNIGGGALMRISQEAVSNSYVTQCDYNNLFSNSSVFATYGTTLYNSLSAWQTATPFDDYSISTNPEFASATDLHIIKKELDSAGTAIATKVSTDIDGELRSTIPDIGADEFAFPDNDIKMLEILSPITACGLGTKEPITVKLMNYGTVPQNNIPISFTADGIIFYNDIISTTLNPDDTLIFTFNDSADLSMPGVFNTKAIAKLSTDQYRKNDTITAIIKHIPLYNQYPYEEDFETVSALFWEPATLSGNFNLWQYGTPNQAQYLTNAHSGNNVWITDTIAKYPNHSHTALISPCFDFTNVDTPYFSTWLNFDLRPYGGMGGQDAMILEYSTDGSNWTKVTGDTLFYNYYGSVNTPLDPPYWAGNSNGWKNYSTKLPNALANQPYVKFRFRFQAENPGTTNLNEGIAIDDIYITDLAPNNETDILSFSFAEQTNTAIIDNLNHTVAIEVAHNANLSSLTAIYTLSGGALAYIDTVLQHSGTSINDFTNPVIYTIKAENGIDAQDWTINVTKALNNETAILSFSVPGQIGNTIINADSSTIDIIMPYNSDLSNIIAQFNISQGAKAYIDTILQISDTTANNFNNPVIYTIVAENNINQQDWLVRLHNNLRNEANIISFGINGQVGNTIINDTNNTIQLSMPYGTNLNNLIANFVLSDSAKAYVNSVLQYSGISSNNFSDTLIYNVIAEDNISIKNWQIIISIAPNTATDIIDFQILNQIGNSIINDTNHTVLIKVINGSSLDSLAPTFTLSYGANAYVNDTLQVSGVSIQNFNNPITYTIVAEDGVTSQNWFITTEEAPNNAAEIGHFSITGQEGYSNINNSNHTIDLTMPYGTDLSNLIPYFELSHGATARVNNIIQVSGITANDFTNSVIYEVTAQDSTTIINWTVSVSVAANHEAEFLTYSITNQTMAAAINNTAKTIDVYMPAGTNPTALTAIFTLSDSAVARINNVIQVSNVTSNDFSAAVVYEVTAMDDSTVNLWTVTVHIEDGIVKNEFHSFNIFPNPANDVVNINGTIKYDALTIYNMAGTIVYKNTKAMLPLQINIKSWNSGTYLIKILTDKGIFSLPLIIQ